MKAAKVNGVIIYSLTIPNLDVQKKKTIFKNKASTLMLELK